MNESFAELFEKSQIEKKMYCGSIVQATVVDINKDNVIVNAGLKSECFIPINQFHDENGEVEVSLGEDVDVVLDAIEDGYGSTKLSREQAKRIIAWEKLDQAYESETLVQGVITDHVKGGFTVNVENINAFLPGSLVDTKPIQDISFLKNKRLEFKIIKIDYNRNNIVLSRRAVIEAETNEERDAMIDSIKEGEPIKGIVKNITDYGAFLDLGGIDGLLHITDMEWKRVKHPSEIVEIGTEIEVIVLKFDRDKNRISLGLKQMKEDPWASLPDKYPKGTKIQGKITNLADYGCFVEIEEGIEGLVHVSEMDWVNKNMSPSKMVHLGQEVEVMILETDKERRRISLGMKQCQANPWAEFAAVYTKGSHIKGKVKSITDFGIFVELASGINGLVHMSDISWTEKNEDACRKYTKEEEIETMLLFTDVARERISLGIKQLQKDVLVEFIEQNPLGSIVECVVSKIEPRMVTVNFAIGVRGKLKVSEISIYDEVNDPNEVLKVDQNITVKIIKIDKKKRLINVSIKAKEKDEQQTALDEYGSTNTNTNKPKLINIIKDQLDNLKDGVSK